MGTNPEVEGKVILKDQNFDFDSEVFLEASLVNLHVQFTTKR